MFWLIFGLFFYSLPLLLSVIYLILKNRCEKKLRDTLIYCEDKIPMVFYEASSKLLKRYEPFKNKTKELEVAYERLLLEKEIFEKYKDGLGVWLEELKISLDEDEQRLKELEKLDKNKYEHDLEIYNENRGMYYVYYNNHINGEFFDYDELLEVANYLIEFKKLFNNYFVEIENKRKLLNKKIEKLREEYNSLARKRNSFIEENTKLSIGITNSEKQNNSLYSEVDEIKKENTSIKNEIEKIKAESLVVNTEYKELLRENRKLKNANTNWEYF